MDPCTFNFNNLKIDKQNAMMRYRRLRNIARLFRILELCFVLIFFAWTSSRLPFILKLSGDYFRQLISIIINPLFIFLLSNVIVLTLFAKSGQLIAAAKAPDPDADLYDEFAKKLEINVDENHSAVPESEEETVYEDKQIVGEINTSSCDTVFEGTLLTSDYLIPDEKVLRRSQSENLKSEISEKHCGKLRRSETDVCRKSGEAGESAAEVVDELSNEEFQRAIEAFIAKQLRFHKEEKLAIVPHI